MDKFVLKPVTRSELIGLQARIKKKAELTKVHSELEKLYKYVYDEAAQGETKHFHEISEYNFELLDKYKDYIFEKLRDTFTVEEGFVVEWKTLMCPYANREKYYYVIDWT